ncbi:P2Y purinoceptor 1-like [Fundulus heteroclitus]|uniref:P2Y purinoceptor 1-like n=1 Tax=Fundulus heteroclitus TaxID=8078 RepID=UPI00165A56B5|nr:P2Y purinoceptor 1-like [Fundulus heteroclitus]
MKNSNCTKPNKELFEHRVLPILYILVFIIGLVLYVWGIKSLLRNGKKLRGIDILVINLGVADMLYLLTLPFLMDYYLKGNDWIFGEAFCTITRFCFKMNLYCSIGFLTCISVYRYLAIVYPFEALRTLTVTNSAVISAMVWILVSAQSVPDMFFPKHSGNMTNKCYDTTDWDKVEDYFPYSLSVTFLGFCIPSGIIVGCYGHVTLVVCSSNTVKTDVKQRSSKLLVLLILYFSLCFAPYHVFKNLNLYSRVLMKEGTCPPWNSGVFIAHQASRGLVSLNSALNPLVYLNVNEDMGTQLRQLLQGSRQISRRLFQSKSSSETQTEQEVDSPRKESALLNELHHV